MAQHIPDAVKEELKVLFNKLTDGRPQDYHREYRPRLTGPARWLLIKDGVIRFEVEVEWDSETEKRTNLVVRCWPPKEEQVEAAKKWCS